MRGELFAARHRRLEESRSDVPLPYGDPAARWHFNFCALVIVLLIHVFKSREPLRWSLPGVPRGEC